MQKILSAFADALKLSAEWLATLKDGEEWRSEDEVSEIIRTTLQERVTAAASNSRKAGQREINDQLRKFAKSVGFDPSDLQGRELVAALDEWRQEQFSLAEPQKMSDEDIQKHPIFKKALSGALADAKAAVDAAKAEVESVRKSAQKARVSDIMKPWLTSVLEGGKVVLDVPGSSVSKDARINAILRQIDIDKVSIDDKGQPFMVDDNGNRVTDTFGKEIDFSKYVLETIAEPLYGIHSQNPSHAGANPNPAGASGAGGQGAWKPTMSFKDAADYEQFKLTETDPRKRLEATKSWQHQQKESAAGQ